MKCARFFGSVGFIGWPIASTAARTLVSIFGLVRLGDPSLRPCLATLARLPGTAD